jgi:hypothetical protein
MTTQSSKALGAMETVLNSEPLPHRLDSNMFYHQTSSCDNVEMRTRDIWNERAYRDVKF